MIVVPGLRRGRSDRQDFNTSLLKPADLAFLMLAAAFGCRGILVDHPLKLMGGNILILAAIGANIPMVILVGQSIGAAAVRLRPLRVENGVIRNTECPAARRIADTCAVSLGIPAGKGVAGLLQIAAVC